MVESVLSFLSASHLFVSGIECHQPPAPVGVRCCSRALTATNGASLKIFPPHSNSARYPTHGGHASSSMTPHSLVANNSLKCVTAVTIGTDNSMPVSFESVLTFVFDPSQES